MTVYFTTVKCSRCAVLLDVGSTCSPAEAARTGAVPGHLYIGLQEWEALTINANCIDSLGCDERLEAGRQEL